MQQAAGTPALGARLAPASSMAASVGEPMELQEIRARLSERDRGHDHDA
jgi:hypothetical protein